MQNKDIYPDNFIRFLGTSGTRFVMLSQRRASGGIWFSMNGASGVIDPGPGSLVQICAAQPQLSPTDIEALILTHRHIDHCCDLNVLAEAMTLKTRSKKGTVLMPSDSLAKGDSVLLKFVRKKIQEILIHSDGVEKNVLNNMTVESIIHKHHGVECYGLIFRPQGLPQWGIISDTAALPHFPERYKDCRMIVINTTLPLPWTRLDHISITDVASMLEFLHPDLMILTHMGRHILDIGPEKIAAALSTKKTKVIAADDGMIVNIADGFSIYNQSNSFQTGGMDNERTRTQ